MPWKQSFPWKFSLYWIYFLHSGVLGNLRLPWKTEFALNSQSWIYIFLLLRIFEQLALALKNRVALKFFTLLNMHFLSLRIFEQLALALKTEFALKIFKPGGAADPPDSPSRTPMKITEWTNNAINVILTKRHTLPYENFKHLTKFQRQFVHSYLTPDPFVTKLSVVMSDRRPPLMTMAIAIVKYMTTLFSVTAVSSLRLFCTQLM